MIENMTNAGQRLYWTRRHSSCCKTMKEMRGHDQEQAGRMNAERDADAAPALGPMFDTIRSANPVWFLVAAVLVVVVLAVVGIEAGYFGVVAHFMAATYRSLVALLTRSL